MLCKGAYPYEYMTSMTKFDETALPPQSAFHNRLNEQPLSDVDYEHAQQVWSLFECQILCDYHNLYLPSDVYLLADIFEKFCADSQTLYELEPVHSYSLTGLLWDAALKHTGVKPGSDSDFNRPIVKFCYRS